MATCLSPPSGARAVRKERRSELKKHQTPQRCPKQYDQVGALSDAESKMTKQNDQSAGHTPQSDARGSDGAVLRAPHHPRVPSPFFRWEPYLPAQEGGGEGEGAGA